MNRKEINIEVDKQGNTKVAFQGFQGNLCFDEAEKIYTSLMKLGVDLVVTERKELGVDTIVTEEGGQNADQGM